MKPSIQPAAVAPPAMAQLLPFLSSSVIRSRPGFCLGVLGALGAFAFFPIGFSQAGAAWEPRSQEEASQVVRAPVGA